MKKIRDLKIFSSLSEEEIAHLERISQIYELSEGEVLFSEGDEDRDIFVVIEGAIAIKKKISGGEKTLAILKEGEIFGEMALFEKQPRSATACAVQRTEILRIEGENFEKFIQEKPEKGFLILLKMIKISSFRLRTMDKYFTVVYDIARKISSAKDLKAVAEILVNDSVETIGASTSALYLWNIFNEEFDLVYSNGDVSIFNELIKDENTVLQLKEKEFVSVKKEVFIHLNTIKCEGNLFGIFAISKKTEFTIEDKILSGTLSHLAEPVILNLNMKKEQELKNELEQKKWQF
ncbi:MAG: cyclic nucleotide-binding domain-containing protein [Elusimicrobia bacterium]|nr:cyclic nucleotide-binding domain-containing protein [Elusimicrobiota bacterium]